MGMKHYTELGLLSSEIYDQASEQVINYCADKYCGVGNNVIENQLVVCLFVL